MDPMGKIKRSKNYHKLGDDKFRIIKNAIKILFSSEIGKTFNSWS